MDALEQARTKQARIGTPAAQQVRQANEGSRTGDVRVFIANFRRSVPWARG